MTPSYTYFMNLMWDKWTCHQLEMNEFFFRWVLKDHIPCFIKWMKILCNFKRQSFKKHNGGKESHSTSFLLNLNRIRKKINFSPFALRQANVLGCCIVCAWYTFIYMALGKDIISFFRIWFLVVVFLSYAYEKL